VSFTTRKIAARPDAIAPDGSEVRILAATARGSMAHFRLEPGAVSKAIVHRSVDEIWYVLAGRGRMWRKSAGAAETIALEAGISLMIPVGTHFQFRCDGDVALEAVAVTMPPWPGADEALEVAGIW